MSYATIEEFRTFFAAERNRLQLWTGLDVADINSQIQLALDAASGQMDAAFADGQYAIPLDTSALNSDQLKSLQAILAIRCIHLAIRELVAAAMSVVPENVEELAERSQAWLNSIRGVKGPSAYGGVSRIFSGHSLPYIPRIL